MQIFLMAQISFVEDVLQNYSIFQPGFTYFEIFTGIDNFFFMKFYKDYQKRPLKLQLHQTVVLPQNRLLFITEDRSKI